jgi:hypothetical protein
MQMRAMNSVKHASTFSMAIPVHRRDDVRTELKRYFSHCQYEHSGHFAVDFFVLMGETEVLELVFLCKPNVENL